MNDPATVRAAVAELANALQIAVPLTARMRERADALTQDAERLELAIGRAADAMRGMQPPADGKGGGR